jgi:ribonuclease HI
MVTVPSDVDARMPDSVRLQDIATTTTLGLALVYWVDGPYGCVHAVEGFMGAGVVWQESGNDRFQSYKLGLWTGNNEDAEVFTIAAALGQAKKEVEEGRVAHLFRVFSDAKGVLEALERGTMCRFGPMLMKRTALQGIYERADWLASLGIQVELVWVKSHSNSEGNRLADQAASRAVKEQAFDLNMDPSNDNSVRHMARADVPAMWKELGPDWADEWLLRANEHIINRKYAYKYEEFDVQEEQFDVREETIQVATTQPGDYNAISVSKPIELTNASRL